MSERLMLSMRLEKSSRWNLYARIALKLRQHNESSSIFADTPILDTRDNRFVCSAN